MPRNKQWTRDEIQKVWAMKNKNMTQLSIARNLGRSQNSVSVLLKRGPDYIPKPRKGRPKKTSAQTDRRILRLAGNQDASTSNIANAVNTSLESNEKISKWTVQRRLKKSKIFKYSKMKKTLSLKAIHKEKRLKWARFHMTWEDKWAKVIFSDEKKFNLDGPDGLKYYWHDLRKEPRTFFSRTFGGGSLMIWGAFCKNGKTSLAIISHKMDAICYQDMLCDYALPFFGELDLDDTWTFQQDNARPHSAASTKDFFNTIGVNLMEWPPYSPDLNPMENLWGILSRKVYANGRQFLNLIELKAAILEAWDEISPNVLESLISSMPSRVFDVISKKGGAI